MSKFALLFVAASALAFSSCKCGDAPEATPGASPAADGSAALAPGEAAPEGSAAAAPTGSGTVTIYSGRDASMVAPLIAAFEQATGIDAQVNYASSPELAATILEEGPRSPADVFFAQDSATLGLMEREGRLAELPAETVAAVPAGFRAASGRWVGTSGRARVFVYNTNNITPEALPADVLGFTDARWKGRVGWSPENASFQSFLAAMVQTRGEEATRAWVQAMLANEARAYPSNTPGVVAVGTAEIDVMLSNHYYLYRVLTEHGAETPIANHFPKNGQAESLVNVAGVGILNTAPNADNAQRFVDFLLSDAGQLHFANSNAEFPVISTVATPQQLPPIGDLAQPPVDLGDFSGLEAAVRILQETGAL